MQPIRILIGGSPCFRAGTMVRTIDGFKEIQEISEADYVLTHTGRYKRVLKTMSHEVNSFVRLKAENAEIIECTPNHQFYTNNVTRTWNGNSYTRTLSADNKWTKVEDFTTIKNSSNTIKEQTYLCSVNDQIYKQPQYFGCQIAINSNLFEWRKTLDVSDVNFWYIVGRWLADGWYKYKYKTDKKLSGIIICCGKHKAEYLENKIKQSKLSYYKNEEKTTMRFTFCNVELAKFMQNFGSGATGKYIFKEVFFYEPKYINALLEGYFDADGSSDANRIQASSVSKQLIYGIKYLVNKYLKRPCGLQNQKQHSNIIEGRKVNTHDVYTISFPEQKKKQKHYIIKDNYIFAPYKSIETINEPTTVYNLSVEEDESYTANGLVVHNCTHWSIAQKNNRETTAEGEGWELFKNYLIAKEKFKPDFFLYENNKSASQEIKDQIAKEFGIETDENIRLTHINSALVSAQNRQRFYVTNFGDINQPEDRGIVLKDILEPIVEEIGYELKNIQRVPDYGTEKSRPITAHYPNNFGGWPDRIFNPNPAKQQIDLIAEPINICENGKSHTIKAQYYKNGTANFITNGGFPATAVAEQIKPIRIGDIGSTSQAHRVYSCDGKSVTINAGGGGQGGKTGLYISPIECYELDDEYYKGGFKSSLIGQIKNNGTYKNGDSQQPSQQYRVYSGEEKSVCLNTGGQSTQGIYMIRTMINGKETEFPIYEIKDKTITINGKEHPINLEDGFYIIRKLTVKECERLQTLPDGFCGNAGVSPQQCYKAIGNGWTAEVIIHILNHALKDVPRDTPLEVLSMYDGIATGRYCLEKMGFTDIKYVAVEIDKYAKQIALHNYPDIIQIGDAFQVREDDFEEKINKIFKGEN